MKVYTHTHNTKEIFIGKFSKNLLYFIDLKNS